MCICLFLFFQELLEHLFEEQRIGNVAPEKSAELSFYFLNTQDQMEPVPLSVTDHIRDARHLIRTAFMGLKIVIWSVTHSHSIRTRPYPTLVMHTHTHRNCVDFVQRAHPHRYAHLWYAVVQSMTENVMSLARELLRSGIGCLLVCGANGDLQPDTVKS